LTNIESRAKTFLRPREASAYTGVPLGTIYSWYAAGKINGINVNGKSLRIFSKSLFEFLESQPLKKG
jgi:excisionase family DNA binding protein